MNHTYDSTQILTTTMNKITVNSSNLVSAVSASIPYLVDIPITNLTLLCLDSKMFVYTNNSLPFRVTGFWGNYLELVISRQDGSIMLNETFTYQPYYEFNLTFWEPNLWYMTVTASNYVGRVSFTMAKPVMAIQIIGAGCSSPYVDVIVPNACVPGKTCDTNYPALNALSITRSTPLTLKSNTTNYCPRAVSF